MKFKWEKKYAQIAFWVCLVVLFTVVTIFFFLNYNDFGTYLKNFIKVLNPIIYGVVITYVLNKIMRFYESKVFRFLDKKPGRMRMKRVFSLVATYITAIAILASFIWIMVPQVMEGLNHLRNNLPNYIRDIYNWLDGIANIDQNIYDAVIKGLEYISGLYGALDGILETLMPKLTGLIGNVVTFLKDLIIGIILSVYFLMQKEKFIAQGKRLARAVLPDGKYDNAISLMKSVDNSFGGYLVAMGVDSFLVMIEGFILFGLAGIPFYPLISLIVGVTNFIPFFGPFIGAIPSAVIIFIVDPFKVIPFVLLVLVIQQIDGNIIAPKIIGNHIGISSVWVVIAITVMSGLFGFMGMIIGVPLFSVVYTLIDNAIAGKLEKKNYDTDIIDFYSEDSMGKTIEMEMLHSRERRAQQGPVWERLKSFFRKEPAKSYKKSSSWDDSISVEEIINDFNAEFKGFDNDSMYATDETEIHEFYDTDEADLNNLYPYKEDITEDLSVDVKKSSDDTDTSDQ